MSPETASQAIDFCLSQARSQEVDHLEIVFFGGEPLLSYPLLCSVIDEFRGIQTPFEISFKMSTNGTLLTEEIMEELSRRKVYVSISMDGDPSVQNRQRPDVQGRGTAEQLEPVMDRLLRWNPCANVNAVVTPESAPVLDQSVKWLREQGFSYISTTLDYSANWTLENLKPLKSAYERLATYYLERTLAGDKFYISCFDEKIRSHARGPLDPSERCVLGYRQFSIAPSGRLYPCVQFVGEDQDSSFVIGDVRTGFNETNRNSIFCCSEQDKPECDGCALKSRCSSWCACVNWQSTGRIDQASPVVCEHERMLLPIVDRVASRLWKRRDPLFIHKHYNPAFPVFSFLEDLVLSPVKENHS